MANTFKGIARDTSGKGGHATRGRIIEGREESSSPMGEKNDPVLTEKAALA